MVPYVHSNFERIKDDNYQTVDSRCIEALLGAWRGIGGSIVDCCAPQGSGIVRDLQVAGYNAEGVASGGDIPDGTDWIVTNPPYIRGVVDQILNGVVAKVRSREIFGAAFLMRANFDFAKSRASLFGD